MQSIAKVFAAAAALTFGFAAFDGHAEAGGSKKSDKSSAATSLASKGAKRDARYGRHSYRGYGHHKFGRLRAGGGRFTYDRN